MSVCVTFGVVGWLATFAKVGSGLAYGHLEYLEQSKAFPRLLITGDPLRDYTNYSILPIAIGRMLGAGTVRSFAVLQLVILAAGSTGVLTYVAHRRPRAAIGATAAMFSTFVPAYALFFMSTYDQLLVVLILAVVLADRVNVSAALGVALGLTHAEVGGLVLCGLIAVALVGVGPRVVVRVWALLGVVAAKVGLTIWLHAAGQRNDRFSFASAYGPSRLLDYFSATWPVIVWTAAGGGWLVILAVILRRRSRRFTIAVTGVLVANLGAAALTTDQSRVAMMTTMALVVALGAFGFDESNRSESPPMFQDRRVSLTWAIAAVIGLASPLVISWVGVIHHVGNPLRIGW